MIELWWPLFWNVVKALHSFLYMLYIEEGVNFIFACFFIILKSNCIVCSYSKHLSITCQITCSTVGIKDERIELKVEKNVKRMKSGL